MFLFRTKCNLEKFKELPLELLNIILQYHHCKKCLILKNTLKDVEYCTKCHPQYHPKIDEILQKIKPLFMRKDFVGTLASLNTRDIMNEFVVYVGKKTYTNKNKIYMRIVDYDVNMLTYILLCQIVDVINTDNYWNIRNELVSEATKQNVIVPAVVRSQSIIVKRN